jgi:formate dehydrogenase major subunit
MTAVQVSPSNGPTQWQEQYRQMAENSRRIAGAPADATE